MHPCASLTKDFSRPLKEMGMGHTRRVQIALGAVGALLQV